MNHNEIKQHWQNWADSYGTDLRATTKTTTIKALECEALKRAVEFVMSKTTVNKIMEMGCGNGYNCFYLARCFPALSITGIDYIPKMVQSAEETRLSLGLSGDRIKFSTGDILDQSSAQECYDIIFTNRCIINLNTDELQGKAIDNLSRQTKKHGYLLLLENFQESYAKQNTARSLLGLPVRKPADFNHFINESSLIEAFERNSLELVFMDNFASLHDLILYIIVPAINKGAVDYEHPAVQAATHLSLKMSSVDNAKFGDFGQNRLYVTRKN